MEDRQHPACGLCKKGVLVPVNLGKGPDRALKYRCTNSECNARFDEHGYETFDPETQTWARIGEG